MYIVNSLEEIVNIVSVLTENDYNEKIEYVRANYEEAKQYAVVEDWIYTNIIKTNNF